MNVPVRKSPRIPGYDYSTENYYFVTICANEKKCIFGEPGNLNIWGKIAEADLINIPNHFPAIRIEKAVVMPNHVHAIVVIDCQNEKGTLPNLNVVIGQYKAGVTRKIRSMEPGVKVWQRSYHDHVIRNRSGYEKIWSYIDTNPQRWSEDCFFAGQKLKGRVLTLPLRQRNSRGGS